MTEVEKDFMSEPGKFLAESVRAEGTFSTGYFSARSPQTVKMFDCVSCLLVFVCLDVNRKSSEGSYEQHFKAEPEKRFMENASYPHVCWCLLM